MRKNRRAVSRDDGLETPTFDLSVAVARTPQEVFAWLADVQDHEPIPRRTVVRMVKEPPGPTRVGTRWHEQVKLAPGWWLRVESIATRVEDPDRLEMDFRSPWFCGHLAYELDEAETGTVLHQRETIRLRAPLGWLTPLVERSLRSHLVERLGDIRAVLEGSA